MITTTLLTAVLLTATPDSSADDVVAKAFQQDIGTKPELVKTEGPNLIVPGLALLGLAALAFVLKRRQKAKIGGNGISIIEAASLGDKRSLVIADVMGERLVLGVSEAGISVLMNRAVPVGEEAPLVVPVAERVQPMGLMDRLRGAQPKDFDQQLNESMEDQELRAKLQAGMRGVVK